jgi:hypothetical protein
MGPKLLQIAGGTFVLLGLGGLSGWWLWPWPQLAATGAIHFLIKRWLRR